MVSQSGEFIKGQGLAAALGIDVNVEKDPLHGRRIRHHPGAKQGVSKRLPALPESRPHDAKQEFGTFDRYPRPGK
jgi:hypothetical protein